MLLVEQNKKLQLNKVTFRQYLALVFIITKLREEFRCPSPDEIKKEICFSTDRLLNTTLKALEKKGFLIFNGLDKDPIVELTEETKKIETNLIDKLFLIKEYTSYTEIKKQIKIVDTPKNFLNLLLETKISPEDNISSLINQKTIVNRWYGLLEEFPPSLVWNKLKEYNIKSEHTVLDPCLGSGTTITTARLYGTKTVGIDINPTSTFVSTVKTTWNVDLKELKEETNSILNEYQAACPILDNIRTTTEALECMTWMEKHQWLKPRNQNDVAFIKEKIKEIRNKKIKNIFLLALIEAAVEASNASFCPGTSFYPFKKKPEFGYCFENKLRMIYEDLFLIKKSDLKPNPTQIYNKDMREMADYIEPNSIDFLITSPPYPNDLEYTRQTRLDLFLLDYVKNMGDVKEIKEKMIKGSTKLIFNGSNSAQYIQKFPIIMNIVHQLAEKFKDKNWGWDYPRMVQEYFGDIYLALEATQKVMKDNSYALYVVGDQSYKNVLIPVGRAMIDIAKDLNYKNVKLEKVRIRRSTLHTTPLIEEIVILQK